MHITNKRIKLPSPRNENQSKPHNTKETIFENAIALQHNPHSIFETKQKLDRLI
jgi:hypothetical protein